MAVLLWLTFEKRMQAAAGAVTVDRPLRGDQITVD
jgi:hypothetical protein